MITDVNENEEPIFYDPFICNHAKFHIVENLITKMLKDCLKHRKNWKNNTTTSPHIHLGKARNLPVTSVIHNMEDCMQLDFVMQLKGTLLLHIMPI